MQKSYSKLVKSLIGALAITSLISCGGGGGGNSSPPPDSTPSTFIFADQESVELGTDIISSSITVSGINMSTDISIENGEYSINGGAYTSDEGTVTNGQQVTIKHTSAEALETTIESTLTIGGVSDSFSSTTKTTADTTPDPFSFNDQVEVELDSEITSSPITVTGFDFSLEVSVSNGEYSIDGGDFTTSPSSVSKGQQIRVRHTSSDDLSTTTSTTLNIGDVSDTFNATSRSTNPLSYILGCTEIYGVECPNSDDWFITLWEDDLSAEKETHFFRDNEIIRLPQAGDDTVANVTRGGTSSYDSDGRRLITITTTLGLPTNYVYIAASIPSLPFSTAESAPETSSCKTFTLTINDMIASIRPLKMHSPNNPAVPVIFSANDYDNLNTSRDYTVTSCDDAHIVISQDNQKYVEYDSSLVVDGGSDSTSLISPIDITLNNVTESFLFRSRSNFALENKLRNYTLFDSNSHGSSYVTQSDTNIFPVNTQTAERTTFSHSSAAYCDGDTTCFHFVESFNHTESETDITLTYPDFNVDTYTYDSGDNTMSVTLAGSTPSSAVTVRKFYQGTVNSEPVQVTYNIIYDSSLTDVKLPPLPSAYQAWIDNGDITASSQQIMLFSDSRYTGLSYTDALIQRNSQEGLINSVPQNTNYTWNYLFKYF
ncbi:MAG: hypothetical protein K6L73_14355 [Cellvibrionaceae bacterium]